MSHQGPFSYDHDHMVHVHMYCKYHVSLPITDYWPQHERVSFTEFIFQGGCSGIFLGMIRIFFFAQVCCSECCQTDVFLTGDWL